jgi:hypothetical protein
MGDVPEAEYDALVALYESTEGEDWTKNTGWLDPGAREWAGVTVEDRHVIELALGENELRGQIPSELAGLVALRKLDLAFNELRGPIPPELAELSSLSGPIRCTAKPQQRLPLTFGGIPLRLCSPTKAARQARREDPPEPNV